MNNCIGIRNRKYFVGFLLFTSIVCVYGFIASMYYCYKVIHENPTFLKLAEMNNWMLYISIPAILLGAYGFIHIPVCIVPLGIGALLLAVFMWTCIGFEDRLHTMIPYFIAGMAAVYGIWAIWMSQEYLGYACRGMTKKEKHELIRAHREIPDPSWEKLIKYFTENVPDSELVPETNKSIEMKQMVVT